MYSFRFAKDFDFETWEVTNEFLHGFCMRYGILFKHITGESIDCPDYTQFMEEVLTPLLMQYEPQDVYNADETSLYYKCLPDRTYAFEHERVRVFTIGSNYCWSNYFCLFFFCSTQVRGSKQWNSKDHLSVMFTVNMTDSDKRPQLIIGKATRPSALKKKNVLLKNLKIEYYNNTRTWMNGPIFHSHMKNWNDELARQ